MLVEFFGSEEEMCPPQITESSPLPASPQPAMAASGPTQRSRAKESRRQALLSAAATLFAVNGFNRVSLEDLGAAAGVSGPAVYRHFPESRPCWARCCSPSARTCSTAAATWWPTPPIPPRHSTGLVQFHVDFALSNPDVIRVQDRDFSNLTGEDQARCVPCSAATWRCGWTCWPASTAQRTRPTSACAPTRRSA
jgi:hypothetical protein